MEIQTYIWIGHLHIPLEKLLEKSGVAHSHDHQVVLPNCTKGTQVFRCSLGTVSPPALLLPLCSDRTLGSPKRIPSEAEAVQLSPARTRWAAWSCMQMWTHQLCRSRSTLQGCSRKELLQLPQTKYLPALVLG